MPFSTRQDENFRRTTWLTVDLLLVWVSSGAVYTKTLLIHVNPHHFRAHQLHFMSLSFSSRDLVGNSSSSVRLVFSDSEFPPLAHVTLSIPISKLPRSDLPHWRRFICVWAHSYAHEGISPQSAWLLPQDLCTHYIKNRISATLHLFSGNAWLFAVPQTLAIHHYHKDETTVEIPSNDMTTEYSR
jgi:hypothetical protein